MPGVLTSDEVSFYRSELELAMDSAREQYRGLPGHDDHFAIELLGLRSGLAGLLDNPTILDVFEHFLSQDCILYAMNSVVVPPATEMLTHDLHVDQLYWVGPDHIARMMVTLALDDFTEENGATRHMPGSHRLEQRPSDGEFDATAELTSRKAGDALFFNSRNWHAAGHNSSGKTRMGVGISATRAYMKQRFDYPHMDFPEVVDRLSERGKRFLGLYARPPRSAAEFYRDPEDRAFRPDDS